MIVKTQKLSTLIKKGHKLLPNQIRGQLFKTTTLCIDEKNIDTVKGACALGKAIFATIPIKIAKKLINGTDGQLKDHIDPGSSSDNLDDTIDILFNILSNNDITRNIDAEGSSEGIRCPFMYEKGRCPAIRNVIDLTVHLNDKHKWTTEQIITFYKSHNL